MVVLIYVLWGVGVALGFPNVPLLPGAFLVFTGAFATEMLYHQAFCKNCNPTKEESTAHDHDH